ncbi:MAG: hypothetical protein EPO26_05220 [Chloroflexota bacterium]|nr:MAG: hypothetical protein EPO26_05220 [Chloroflexota bacterium]
MVNRNVGFNRNILLPWLDAAAAIAGERSDPTWLRCKLDPIVALEIASRENRRKAIDILINIWLKSREFVPALREEAVERFQTISDPSDRLWLHYGLTLLYYPFVRDAAAAIGQIALHHDTVTPALVKQRVAADRGQLGSLAIAVERILYSLRNWNVLSVSDRRYVYVPRRGAFATADVGLQCWLLACALRAHPAEELPFPDLPRLPELFPFRYTATVEDLRKSPCLEIQRQGSGWDSVRVVDRLGTLSET